MRAACTTLGLSKNGSKAQCWDRLIRHLQEAELLRSHQVEHALKAEMARPPKAPPIAQTPSAEDVKQHELTHEPFQPWCKTCVRFRARQDKHPSEHQHADSGRATISMDFGYFSREPEAEDQLTCLFLKDRFTQAVHAIPTARKGRPSLTHMVTEAARFVIWLGHRKVKLRSDNEPSIVAVSNALQKALRGLGLDVSKDTTPVDSHQSNGPVEQTVEIVRQHAAVLMSDLEQACGATEGQILFGTNHPIYGWAICHAAWLRNRYSVANGGRTAYECITDSPYQGSICRYGEKVLGYLRPSGAGKSNPRWQHALWLGKASLNDVHVLGTAQGVFVTRAVRRFDDSFDKDLAASFSVCVWEHGLSSIGGQLVLSKKRPGPTAMPVPRVDSGPEPVGPDGSLVPSMPAPGLGSGQDLGLGPAQGTDEFPLTTNVDGSDHLSDYSPSAGNASMRSPVPSLSTDQPSPSSPPVAMQAEADTAQAGSAPILEENPRPAKAARSGPLPEDVEGQVSLITCSGDLADQQVRLIVECDERPCFACIQQIGTETTAVYEHEDELPVLSFDPESLDDLEDYDASLLEDHVTDQEIDPALCRPRFDDVAPELPAQELAALDRMADDIEIERLIKMGVLLPESAAEAEYPDQVPTKLTTKMVRTWREKTVEAKEVWFRRSRFVAREYAFLSERADLFSPASTALGNRLLPILYLQHAQDPSDPWILCSLDVADAYLTVKQTRLVLVSHGDRRFVLGRLLPGQRIASKEWYQDFSSHLDTQLSFAKCPALPSLVRDPLHRFFMQLRVDDMLGAGSFRFLTDALKPALEVRYKVKIQVLESPGDSINFLKRHHTLLSHGKLLLQPSSRHFEKLFGLLGISERSVKKTPYLAAVLDEADDSPPLSASDAKVFRCCIGVLLYLSVDLLECQCAIRALSSYMTLPTVNAMAALIHLVKYLRGVKDQGILLQHNHHGLRIDSFSDSDWATCKRTRRSVSSGVMMVGQNLLYSSSRTQRVVALSSGEAELLAAASCLCDALFVRQLVAFLEKDVMPQVHHHIDAVAAKGMMERAGVGRVRHLSVRVLWIQGLVEDGTILLHKIPTATNPADLGTKCLSRGRMRLLLFLLGAYDTAQDEPVGEDERAELHQKQAMKDAVRAVRSTGQVSKPMIRAIVIAVCSALSRAADDEPNDDNHDGPDEAGWMSLMSDVMAWVIVLCEQYPSLFVMVVQIVLLVVIFICFGMCYRRTAPLYLRDASNHEALRMPQSFDRPLNIHINMHQGVGPAPGTPGNPLGIATDEEDEITSPSHLSGGARSKAKAKPGPRRSVSTSSSSADPPPDLASTTTEGEVDHVSGVSIAVARRKRFRHCAVFVTTHGRCYHRVSCFKLDNSNDVRSLDPDDAIAQGLRPCKKCNA